MSYTPSYSILVDGITVAHYSENEYVDALEDAGSLSHALNSPELNGGIQETVPVELYYQGKPISSKS